METWWASAPGRLCRVTCAASALALPGDQQVALPSATSHCDWDVDASVHSPGPQHEPLACCIELTAAMPPRPVRMKFGSCQACAALAYRPCGPPQELQVAVLCRLMVMHMKDALDVARMPWSDVGSLTGATDCRCCTMLESKGALCHKSFADWSSYSVVPAESCQGF